MIQTKNLSLRPFKEPDLKHMQRYAVREDYYRFLPLDPLTPASVEGFLHYLLAKQHEDGTQHYHFAIEPDGVGHIVGAINIRITDKGNKIGEIGYALDSDFRRQGIMNEALIAVLEFGFKELSLHRFTAYTDTENEKSRRVLESVGFKREGLLRGDKLVRGDWRDSYLSAILQSEWDS